MSNAIDDMDALDAELFGTNTSKFASKNPQPRKKVSFVEKNKKGLDINYDDPLEGLLSCSEDEELSQSKNVYQPSSTKHNSNIKSTNSDSIKSEDDLFGDEGLKAVLEMPDENKTSNKNTSRKLEAKKVLDDILVNKNVRSRLNNGGSSKNLQFDKDGNFIKKAVVANKEDIFGNYVPSTKGEKSINSSSIQKFFSVQDNKPTVDNEVLNLILDEKSSEINQKDRKHTRPSSAPKPTTSTKERLANDELSLSHQENELSNIFSRTSQLNKNLNNRLKSNLFEEAEIEQDPNLTSSKRENSSRYNKGISNASSTEKSLNFLIEKSHMTSQHTQHGPIFHQPPVSLETDSNSFLVNSKNIQKTTSISNERVEALEMQVNKLRSQLAQIENGFTSDRDITKQTYDSRIELLQGALSDMKTRNEREMSIIRENYSIRLDNIRSQVKEYLTEVNEKELLDVNEISKMRKLHAEAIKDLRRDNEEKERILREVHKKEINSISSYGTHSRSIDAMMHKVDETMKKVHNYIEKYEHTFNELGNKFETATQLSSQSINDFTEKVKMLEKMSQETNNNLQNSISRYDKRLVELDLKFDEQISIMRKEQYLLSSAKNSLDEERNFFRFLAEANKEQMQKIQDSSLEEQQKLKRQIQNEREKLHHKEQEDKEDYRKKCRELNTQFERLSIREEELSRQNEMLLEERAEVKRRNEKLDDIEINNASKREETEIKLIEAKRRLMEIEKKENKLNLLYNEFERKKQTESKRVLEGEIALKQAEVIKNEQTHRIRQLNNVKDEITEQRKKLAQERKVISDEYNNNSDIINQRGRSHVSSKILSHQFNWRFSNSPQSDTSELNNEASSVLGIHDAQNDHHFLESEEFYLETLKNSPYSGNFDS